MALPQTREKKGRRNPLLYYILLFFSLSFSEPFFFSIIFSKKVGMRLILKKGRHTFFFCSLKNGFLLFGKKWDFLLYSPPFFHQIFCILSLKVRKADKRKMSPGLLILGAENLEATCFLSISLAVKLFFSPRKYRPLLNSVLTYTL